VVANTVRCPSFSKQSAVGEVVVPLTVMLLEPEVDVVDEVEDVAVVAAVDEVEDEDDVDDVEGAVVSLLQHTSRQTKPARIRMIYFIG
jgi:hypothetical protein